MGVGNCACPEFCQFLDHNDPLCEVCEWTIFVAKEEHWCGLFYEFESCPGTIKAGAMYAFMWREVEGKIRKFPVHKECLEEWEREKGA